MVCINIQKLNQSNASYTLLDLKLFCWVLLPLCSWGYRSILFSTCMSLSDFGNAGLIKWAWKYFLCFFSLNKIVYSWHNSFLKCLVKLNICCFLFWKTISYWYNLFNIRWTPGVGDGQGGLACCDSWGRKELDMTEQLNWTQVLFPGKCHGQRSLLGYRPKSHKELGTNKHAGMVLPHVTK